MGACGRRRRLGGLALLLQVGCGRRRRARCGRQLMGACGRRGLRGRLALLLQVLWCRRRRRARRSWRPWRRRLRRSRGRSRWLRMLRRCCGRRWHMHRGRRSRRRGMRRRCCCGWHRVRRRRSLRRRLRLSVGTKFFLRLRHNYRRGLRVRWNSHELQCRESGRGKQHKTKFCHDGLGSPGKSSTIVWRSTNRR
jgi:hypothetical protein